MDMLFNESEIRVLSSLVEKAVTTPDNYPLTLNALINACNQKSNRDPMTAYTGQTVGAAIDSLKQRGLIRVIMGGDSRVPKYREYFAEAFSLAPPEAAVLCELMLRGPQTSGELRGRIERFGVEIDVQEVETILGKLMARAEPLVVKLPLRPGRKEARYAHLLAGQTRQTRPYRRPRRPSAPRASAWLVSKKKPAPFARNSPHYSSNSPRSSSSSSSKVSGFGFQVSGFEDELTLKPET